MEGRVVWQQEPHLPVLDRFGFTTVTSPAGYEIIDGVDGTFTEGLAYANDAQTPLSMFYLEPEPPAYSVFTSREDAYCAGVAFDEGSYKTIGTIFEFGSLLASDSCKLETLMDSILTFFEISLTSLGIEEAVNPAMTRELRCYPNPFSYSTRIPFTLDNSAAVYAAVYDLQGRRIYELTPSTLMDAGDHQFTWDGTNMEGQAVPDGIYIFSIIADDIRYNGKMVLIR